MKKILLINKFLYPKGGDAICTLATGELLRAHGHEIVFWGMRHPDNADFSHGDNFVDNVDYIQSGGIKKQLRMAANLLYSTEAKKKIEIVVKKEKPDIVHLHNFAHQISPSILSVFKKYNIPVVMTMHDYKLVCPAYAMLSKGNVCEKCKDGRYINCFLNKCTKESSSKSFLNAIEMYLHHSILHIYDLVDTFISPSKFLKNKVEEMGFTGKVVHLPNFVNLEGFSPQYEMKERCLVYCGRLSGEKGVPTLIAAVRGLDVPVKIIGDGPIRDKLKQMAEKENLMNVQFLGYRTGEDLKNQVRQAFVSIIPSECYENNPRSVIESFALGTPVIGARIGGIPELVRDGETGITFESGNIYDLHEKINYLINNPEKAVVFGKKARRCVEQEFNAERHYEKLIEIYTSAMKSCVSV